MPTLKQPTPETIPIPPGHAFDGLPDVGRSPTTDAYKYTLICDCCEDRFTTEISGLAVLAGGPYQLTWTRHAKRPPFRHGRGASLASAQETQVPDFAYPDDGVRLETTEELLAELRLMRSRAEKFARDVAINAAIGIHTRNVDRIVSDRACEMMKVRVAIAKRFAWTADDAGVKNDLLVAADAALRLHGNKACADMLEAAGI